MEINYLKNSHQKNMRFARKLVLLSCAAMYGHDSMHPFARGSNSVIPPIGGCTHRTQPHSRSGGSEGRGARQQVRSRSRQDVGGDHA